MKRIFTTCLFITFSFIIQSHSQNLVTNGNFENSFTGWNNSVGGGAVANYSVATTNMVQGTKAFGVSISTLGTNAWDISTSSASQISVTVGKTYTVTLYARSSSEGGRLRLVVQNANYLAKDFFLTTNWTKFTWTFKAVEANPYVRFHFGISENIGKTLFVDDIQIPVPATPNTSFSDVVNITPSITYQTIEGIGGGLCFYQNWFTAHPNKSEFYNLIFKDLGITFLRLNNGYSDTTNKTLSDDREFVTQAKSLLGYTPKILVTSWSPPAYLKENNSQNGTNTSSPSYPFPTLKKSGTRRMYPELGNWWKKSIQQYQSVGINPDYISIQNELNYNPGYPGCLFSPSETSNLAGFDKALHAVDSSTKTLTNRPKILGPETFGIAGGDFQNYIAKLNRSQLYGYCYHLYTGGDFNDPDSFIPDMQNLGNAYSDKPKFMTEYIGVTSTKSGADTLSSTLNLAWLIHNSLVYEQASAYVFWDLLWGEKGDIISVEFPWDKSKWSNSKGYVVQQPYYALKQFSKFIRSGWKRVEASNSSTSFRSSAYMSADGDSMAVVILNVGNSSGSMGLNLGSFAACSGKIYQTNGSSLKCDSVGVYVKGAKLNLPARSITTVTLNSNVPVVSITSPAANSTVTSDVFPINTTVTGTNISNVSFFNGASLLGTITKSPYNFTTPSLSNGTYTFSAIVKNTANCADTAKVTVKVNKTVTGFSDGTLGLDGSSISPNPFSDYTVIQCKGSFEYVVTDAKGIELQRGKSVNEVALGNGLQAGVYFVSLSNEQGIRTVGLVKK